MGGRRILRLFTNIAPDGAARAWRVGEPFADFARRFLPRTGARCRAAPGCCSGWASPRAAAANTTGSCCGCTIRGSSTRAYQSAGPKADVAFAAGTTWLCFTDQVLHAALAGHCALEQTFHLPVAAMAHPERSPLRVLERLAGRSLV